MEEFLNRLHPAVVHFPIALLLAAALFELAGLLKPGWRLRGAASWALGLGALGALAAAAVFHPNPQVEGLPFAGLFEWHEILAWCTVALALPLAALRFWLLRKGPEPLEHGLGRWGFAAGLVLVAALVGGAGYCGGQLVFEHGLGVTAPMPAPLPAAPAGTAVP